MTTKSLPPRRMPVDLDVFCEVLESERAKLLVAIGTGNTSVRCWFSDTPGQGLGYAFARSSGVPATVRAIQDAFVRAAAQVRSTKSRYPRAHEARAQAPRWANGDYQAVCRYMRGGRRGVNSTTTVRHIDAFMKHSALRVPTRPRVLPDEFENPTVLWRGVRLKYAAADLRPGSVLPSNGGCYTAFSIEKGIAETFAGDEDTGTLIQLSISNIARGTPWIWYTGNDSQWRGRGAADVEVIKGLDEGEVLLPPGFFRVIRVSNDGYTVQVAFVPEPAYLRRGALPARSDAGVTVDTATGKWDFKTEMERAIKSDVPDRRLTRLVANRAAQVALAKKRR